MENPITNYTLPLVDGYVEVDLDGARLYKRLSDDRLFNHDMSPLIPYTQAEKRKIAYETEAVITFGSDILTVDEAEKLFWQYFPDSEKESVATELKTLISTAKSDIRSRYPDENTEEGAEA